MTRFDALAPTSVTVQNRSQSFFGGSNVSYIPWNAEDQLTRLNGVVAAGKSVVDTQGALVRSVPINDPLGQTKFSIESTTSGPTRSRSSRARS